jgi:hypothetical protein
MYAWVFTQTPLKWLLRPGDDVERVLEILSGRETDWGVSAESKKKEKRTHETLKKRREFKEVIGTMAKSLSNDATCPGVRPPYSSSDISGDGEGVGWERFGEKSNGEADI